MSVTLQNRSGRQILFHLHHDATCSEAKCFCSRRVVGVQDHDPATGQRTLRAHKRRVPDSVTLNAYRTEGDKISGLPDGVLHVPEVAAAISAKQIVCTQDVEGTPPHHVAAKVAHAKSVADKAAKENAAVAKPAAAAEPHPPAAHAAPSEHAEIADQPAAAEPKAEV